MKDICDIEQMEKDVYECMEWMENKIKEVIDNLMKLNEERYGMSMGSYDLGYADGIHDALIDVLIDLEISTDEVHYNP